MTDEEETQVSLLEAARIVARGGGLDQKLAALAGHARRVTGATSAAVLLYDQDTDRLATSNGVEIEPSDADDAVSQAIRARRTVEIPDASDRAGLAELAPGTTRMLLPLVIEGDGGTEVEGLLLVGFDAPVSESVTDTLGAVADLAAVAIRQERLQNALLEQTEYQDRLAHTDLLTGLANRRTFDQMLELELARASRAGNAVSLAVFDVDGFTTINAEAGAQAGDDTLRQVASTLADEVRLVDTVARVGDDEFAVIAPGEGGLIVATRVRDAVAQLTVGGDRRISVCAGVARLPEDGATAAELSAAAEAALKAAQAMGPGSVVGTEGATPA